MPTIIMTKWPVQIDPSVRAKAMAFLQKLATDDTTPGLHVEPILRAADPRVRTGRVDQAYRAVMFRLDGHGETHYVIHGIWPHDDAMKVAYRVRLKVNPINGLPQIEEVAVPEAPSAATAANARRAGLDEQAGPKPREPEPENDAAPCTPMLSRLGIDRDDLVGRLGIPDEVADEALVALDEDTLLLLAQRHEGWVGLMLLDLATGDSVESIMERMELEPHPATGDADDDLIDSLKRPAAQAQFSLIEDQDELRRVIESGDFGAWRIFLHPLQRRYVQQSYSGPFRLSGGAGTGKTVVLVHRSRALARKAPDSRIVMTTFTTNLAESLRESLGQLDPSMPAAGTLGEPGVYVAGIDALAAAVIRSAGAAIEPAVLAVLGEARSQVSGRVPNSRWRAVLDLTSSNLPAELANETFLAAEYATVVIPNRIRSEEDYLRIRRPGRGTALDRKKRSAVWVLIAAYRAQSRIDGSIDYAEAAAIAAAYLEGAGGEARKMADHVLVDEGQDLSPAHWQLLRALVGEGTDDLFIAEDSHQRIYGPRIVLSRYGIRIVGRSQRLTLNYRTTAQNLRYAMTMLQGGEYADLEDAPETTGYRSARSGPNPVVEMVDSVGDEFELIAEAVRTWLAAGVMSETIAILVRDRLQRDRVVNALGERKVHVRAVDRETPPPGRPLVMTMHRAKGMEFSRVILTGAAGQSAAEISRYRAMDVTERADAELRERSLTYVAATRARDELLVIRRS